MVDCGSLENCCTERYRRFESYILRSIHIKCNHKTSNPFKFSAYGDFCFRSILQNLQFPNNFVPGLNANLSAIESFNPNRIQDVHRWIPQGLPYDLLDNLNDGGFPVTDNVVGYSINQVFNALQPNIRSIPVFRDRLLLNSGNNQQVEVNQLFQQYGY